MGKTTWTARLARIYAHTEDSSPIINLPIVNVDGPYLNSCKLWAHYYFKSLRLTNKDMAIPQISVNIAI